MGFHNPRMSWSELEGTLSGRKSDKSSSEKPSGDSPSSDGWNTDRWNTKKWNTDRPDTDRPGGDKPGRDEPGNDTPKPRTIGEDKKFPYAVDPLAVDADGGDSPAWSRKRQPYE